MTRLLGHYELLDRLGQGGMGVVYRARDTKLDRVVALKFLNRDSGASDEAIESFLHEARAISKLNHPNIATIYAVEEDDGERFLAFEYLPGGTLRETVAKAAENGGVGLQQLLSWAKQIARGLAHAHRHGIIHRDVKTENALLTYDGKAKLTDFGIAQTAEPGGHAATTAGTAAYMSPEQAQGFAVDHRSDIFSFGAVLYELAAGKPPFWDEQEAVVLYDIVNSPTPSLREQRRDLPRQFEEIVGRSLAKDPDERFQTMEDVTAALEELSETLRQATAKSHAPVLQVDPTIAVLPFVDMSPQRDQEYFCDGIVEEITLALSEVKGLKVVSRTSAFQFKDSGHDVRAIGEQLKVDTLLEGSVRKAGDKLRISVQHVNVADGYHLWAARYDRKLEDVFAIQDEIAQAIAETLRVHVSEKRKTSRKTASIAAYNLYLEGRYHLNQRTNEDMDTALQRFEQATALDENYASAWAGQAETHILRASRAQDVDGPRSAVAKARQAAERALKLDDSLAEAHVSMAMVRWREWDFSGAEAALVRAIELNDNYAPAHHRYALLLATMMRLEESRAEIARAHDLDPLSLLISTAIGRIWHFSRDYDKAIEQFLRTIELNPSFAQPYFDLSLAYNLKGEFDKAYEAVDELDRLAPDPARTAMLRARWHADQGNREECLKWRERLFELSGDRHISPMVLSIIEIGLGDLDKAMGLLEEAVEQHDNVLVYLLCEPTWDPIREHPRYPDLVSKVGFPPNQE